MNYKKIYNNIILKAQNENRVKGNNIYYEAHHIIPKCMGGDGSCKDIKHPNIVLLTSREHFICHKLLVKIYPNEDKLKMALYYMVYWKKYTLSSREYEILKKENSKFRKQFKHTDETKQRISDTLTGGKRNEEQKSNMRKPRSTTENMKMPKSEEHKHALRKPKSTTENMKKPKPKGFGEIISNKLKNKQKPPRSITHKKNLSTPIIQFELDGSFLKEWDGIKIAGNKLGINPSTIGMVCRGKQKTAGGYIWKYK